MSSCATRLLAFKISFYFWHSLPWPTTTPRLATAADDITSPRRYIITIRCRPARRKHRARRARGFSLAHETQRRPRRKGKGTKSHCYAARPCALGPVAFAADGSAIRCLEHCTNAPPPEPRGRVRRRGVRHLCAPAGFLENNQKSKNKTRNKDRKKATVCPYVEDPNRGTAEHHDHDAGDPVGTYREKRKMDGQIPPFQPPRPPFHKQTWRWA